MIQSLKILYNIKKYGYHKRFVCPEKEDVHSPLFAYTIGLSKQYKHSEIIVFGPNEKMLDGIITTCAQIIENGGVINVDMQDDRILNGGYDCIFKTVKSEYFDEYLGAGVRALSSQFDCIQCFWPDKNHNFPWEDGYSKERKFLQTQLFI